MNYYFSVLQVIVWSLWAKIKVFAGKCSSLDVLGKNLFFLPFLVSRDRSHLLAHDPFHFESQQWPVKSFSYGYHSDTEYSASSSTFKKSVITLGQDNILF